MKKTKPIGAKILSVLLTLCMLFSAIPSAVFANTVVAPQQESAQESEGRDAQKATDERVVQSAVVVEEKAEPAAAKEKDNTATITMPTGDVNADATFEEVPINYTLVFLPEEGENPAGLYEGDDYDKPYKGNEGKWQVNPDDPSVLQLMGGFNFETTADMALAFIEDSTIELPASDEAVTIRDNGNRSNSIAVYAQKNLNIKGSGQMNVTAGSNVNFSYGIYVLNTFIIDNAQITVNAGDVALRSIGIYALGGLKVLGTSRVEATGGKVEEDVPGSIGIASNGGNDLSGLTGSNSFVTGITKESADKDKGRAIFEMSKIFEISKVIKLGDSRITEPEGGKLADHGKWIENSDGTPALTATVKAKIVEVTGIELDKTEASLNPSETVQLTATVKPDNATNKTVSWSSSNEAVATVDATGKVTAKAAGNANIIVTTEDGQKTAVCVVTVKPTPVKEYKITEGTDSTWTAGSKTGLTIKADGDLSKFIKVMVNDKELDKANYEVKSGSTILTIKPEYLSNLKTGTYKVAVVFTDGEAKTTFAIKGTPTPSPVPAPTPAPTPTPNNSTNVATGTTDTQTGAYCAVIMLALAGLGVLGFKRRMNK